MMHRTGPAFCAIAFAAAVPGAQAASPATGLLRWTGTGSQIYACKLDGGQFGWVLQRPDATLTDDAGQVQGTHGAGPNWTANDGSKITGTVLVTLPAPAAGAVPWLVLRVASHDGAGLLDNIHFVLRTDTVGGAIAPAGCDAAHEGAEARQPYHATYTLLADPAALPR